MTSLFFCKAGLSNQPKVFKECWTLKLLAVKKSLNLGTTSGEENWPGSKILICNVITLFIYLHCDVMRHLLVQIRFVHFSLSIQPLSTNFGQTFLFCITGLSAQPENATGGKAASLSRVWNQFFVLKKRPFHLFKKTCLYQ